MIKDYKVDPNGAAGMVVIDASPATIATGQTGKRCFAWVAPFRGQITAVQAYATSVTASLTFDVQNNGGTSVLSSQVTPTSDAVVSGTLVTTLATLRFKKGDTISAYYTTNGSGAAVNPSLIIAVRPYPMAGESSL